VSEPIQILDAAIAGFDSALKRVRSEIEALEKLGVNMGRRIAELREREANLNRLIAASSRPVATPSQRAAE
jgi:prefoldin subunit 5